MLAHTTTWMTSRSQRRRSSLSSTAQCMTLPPAKAVVDKEAAHKCLCRSLLHSNYRD